MFDEQDRQYFYNEFKSNGYEVGSYDDFKKDLNNKEDRDWYYNEAKNMGYDVGTQADFDKMVLEPAPSTSSGAQQVAASATTQSAGQNAFTETKPQVAQPAAKPAAEKPKEDNRSWFTKWMTGSLPEEEKPETADKEPGLIAKALGMIPTGIQTSNGTYQPSPAISQPVVKGEETPVKEEASPSSSANAASPESKEAAPVTTPTGVVNNEGLMDAKLANYLENWKQRPDKQGDYFENMVADLLADGTANSNEEAVSIVKSALGRYANRSAMDVTNQVVSSLPDDTVQDAEKSIEAQWYSHGVQDKLKQEADNMGISYDDYVGLFLKPAMVQSLVNKYGPNYRNIAEGIATRLYAHDEHVQDRLMNQDINDALTSVIKKYVNPSVVDEYNKAQEAGSKAFKEGMEGSQFIPANLRLGTALGAQYEANEAKDPAKVLSGLQKKFGNLYRNPKFLNDMSNAAFKVMQRYGLNGGMSDDPKQFKPMINSILKNELDQLEIKGMMPKSSAEYIINTGLGNTIVGKIIRKAVQTDYQNWLEDIANQQYQPGFWENVASGALTFAGDAWSYWLPGAAGGKLTKSMLAKAEGRLAGDLMAKGMESRMATRAAKLLIGKSKTEALKSGAVHGAVTFGGQSAISKPIDEKYRTGQFDENGKIYNPSGWKIALDTLLEGGKQGALGVIMQGNTIANMIGKGRGLAANILADIGGKVVDSGIMTGHQMLERMAQDPNFKPTGKDAVETFLESGANLLSIGFPGFVGKYARFKDAREFNKKYDFTDQDIAELKRFGYEDLRDAFEKVGIGEYSVVGENAQRLDGQLTQKYMNLMNDKSVPEVLKAKMMAVVEGKRPSSFSPVVDSVIVQPMDNDGKVYLETLNKDGGIIDRKEYSSLDEAQKADKKLEYEKTLGLASVLEGEFHNEFTQEHLDGLYNQAAQKYNMGEKLTDEDKAAVYLHQNAGAIKEIMDKQQKGIILSEEEQKQVDTYRHFYNSALENSSVMREFVNTFEDSHGVTRGTLRKALESKDKKYASLVESYLKELYNSIELKREMKQTMDDLYNTAHGNEQKRIEQSGIEGEKPAAPVEGAASVEGAAPVEGTSSVEGAAGGQEPPVSEGPAPYQDRTNSVPSPSDANSAAFVMGQEAYKNGDSGALKAIDYNSDLATGRLKRAFADSDTMFDLVTKAYNEGRDMEQFVAQRASSLTPAQKEAISKYVEAMDAKKGAIDALQHADDGYGEALKQQLWPYQTEDGNIVPATLTSGKQVFLKKANEYGGGFVVVPDEQGQPTIKQVSNAEIKEVGTPVSLDEYIESSLAQQKEARNKLFISQFDGSGLKPNDRVAVAMEEGDANIVMVFAGYSEDGKIVLTDGKDYLPLSKEEFAAWRTNALNNTINERLDREDEERELAEMKNAEAEKQERYKKGIFGYASGQPDYSDTQTDPKVAAEYLQETAGEDRKALFANIVAEKQALQKRINQLREHIASNEEWLSVNADLDPKNAETRTLANKQMEGQITDLQARFDNWNKIRSAVMTPEEAQAIKADRTQKIADADVNEGDVAPIEGREVAVLSDEELKKQYPTMDEASDFIASERKRIYRIQSDEVQREIDGVDEVLDRYVNGEIDLEPEQIKELNTTKAQLEARQANLTESAKELKAQADKLKTLYRKENMEARAKAVEDMTPAEQRAIKVENAIKNGNMNQLNSIYEDVRGATDFNDTEPNTLEEYVANNIGRFTLNYEGKEKGGAFSNGIQQETGLGRKDFEKLQILAKEGEGKTVTEFVHGLDDDMPENLKQMGYSDQDIRDAFLHLIRSAQSYSDIKNYTLNNKVANVEQLMRDVERQEEEMKENGTHSEASFGERLKSAIAETETEPTEAQKKAGNYKKGHLTFGGYDFTVETPKGVTRSGKDEQGKPWSVTMHDTYGYILGKIGVDGDHIDMFINDNADLDTFDGNVYVVDQVTPETGEFDEHKVMYGYPSEEAATEAYLANYSKGWKGLGKVTAVPKATFDKWLESSDRKTKPFREYSMIQHEEAKKAKESNEALPFDAPMNMDDLPFHRDVKEVKPSEMTEAQKVAYDAVSTMLKKAGIPVKVVSNEDMEKVAEAQDNLNLAMLLNQPEMRFKIKTPEEKQAAENAYNFAKDLRPNKWAQYAVVDMSNPNKMPEYYQKQELARKERTYLNRLMWGNYKVFNLDKSFEDNVAGLTGSFPSEFDPYKIDEQTSKKNELKKQIEETEEAYKLTGQERKEYQNQLMKEYMDEHGLASENDIPDDVWREFDYKAIEKYQDKLDSLFAKYKDLDRQLKAIVQPGVRFLRTYHGTGASFDKFDFSHMGEGEGSQAFGWGGYVTNSKDIAEDYTRRAKIRKDNGGFEFVTDMSANNKDMVRQYIYKHKDVNKGLDAMRKDLSSALEMFPDDDDLKELSNILAKKNEEIAVPDNIAYLYDVDIPDDNGDYLDWDAPLTDKQKNTIIKELRRLKIDFADFKKRGFSFDGSFGGNAYDFLMYALRKTKKWKDVNASRAVSKFLSSIGFTGIKYKAGTIFGGAKEGDYNYVIFDENNANIVGNTKFAQGKGVVYGYTDGKEIVLNQEHLNPNTPIHEYQHLWRTAAKEMNPDLIAHGDELIKQTQLFADLKEAPNYKHLSDDEICDEAFARLTGGDGAAILEQMAKDAIKENPLDTAKELTIINRLKNWLKKFWYWTLDTFTKWKPEDIKKMTLEDIRNLVLRDLAQGVDPRNVKSRMTKEDAVSLRKQMEESVEDKIKAVSQQFGVDEADVAMYANAVKKGSTAEAARARANIKRHLLQANEDKISSFKDIIKYTKPVNEALKENFGDLDAMIEERVKQVEAQRNAMEAARKRADEEEAKRQKHLEELSVIPDDQLDKQYMDALAKGDDATAREMLDEAARRKGYDDTESAYQGVGAWAAPGNPGYESDKARRDDWESSGSDVNLEDMALGYTPQPDDYFSHPERYSQNTPHGLESVKAINEAIEAIKNGEKDVKVKVYRAVPTSVKEGKLRNGDWVTPSKKYAEMHGTNRLEGKYRIIEDEVPANQLWWDGNDANEFGFDDGKEYKYKNAKNNRKLNDLVTYDDKGDVIPPSKRFNSRKSDIRFMFAGEKGAAEADKAEEKTYRMDNLKVAEKMERGKKDAKAIKLATGWERGADGKWRYEMPDAKIKDMKDIGGGHIVKRYEDDMLWNGGKLSNVIDAPGLFEAYPQLKDVRIDTDAIMNDMPSNGEYNPKTNTITIHADELKYMNSILNHEIQHAIQFIEGFATGGNEDSVRMRIEDRMQNIEDAANVAAGTLDEYRNISTRLVRLELARKWKKNPNSFLKSSAMFSAPGYGPFTPKKEAIEIGQQLADTWIDDAKRFVDSRSERLLAGEDKMDEAKVLAKWKNEWHNKYVDWKDFKEEFDQLDKAIKDLSDYQLYQALAGEVEARNVQNRLGMTNEERRNSLAEETEDVNRDEQIVMNVGDTSYSIVKDPETIKKLDKKANVKYRFGDSYDYEKYPLGRVEPNLANKDVKIVHADANHGFKNFKEARNWAKKNIVKIYTEEETGGKGLVRISNTALDKYLSQKAVDKSDSQDVHLAVLKVLPSVLKESIDAETHPDFIKGADGERRTDNGINKDLLVHRCYGAVNIDGKIYRVKITLKEEARNKDLPHKAYSYEATKIELLAGTLVKPEGDNPNTNSSQMEPLEAIDAQAQGHGSHSNNSISVANLLKNVEMSYDKGKKLLDESEKMGILSENQRKIADSVVNTANKLGGAEATVYSSLDDVPEEYRSEVEQEAKGWYDPETHSVHVYLPNCEDGNDAQRTVLHEKIGHEGMEVLLGGEDEVRKFANFVYNSVAASTRGKILEIANEYDPDWKKHDRMNVGTQEYIARLAEEGPKTAEDFSLWTKIKHYLIKVLKKLGIRVPGLLNDKDLRYYLMKAGKALHVWDNMPKEKQEAMMKQASNAEIKDALSDGAGKGKPRQKKGESAIQFIKRAREWERWKEAREDENDPEPPMFYDFDKDAEGKKEWERLNKEWRDSHHLQGDEMPIKPERKEGETDEAFFSRYKEWEKWNDAMADKENPMPDMFSFEKAKQDEARQKYEDWLTKHELNEQNNADLDLYEGKIYPAETNPKADDLEQQVMQDLAEVTSTDVSKEGAAKTVKHAVIHRRKNMEEASAYDAIYINDVKNRIVKMADSGAFDKLLSEYQGKPNRAEKLAEAIPYIIEAPRRLRDLAHDLNATGAFDKGHIHIQPADVEAIQPYVADLIAETGKKHTELRDGKEVEVYDDPQAVSDVASKMAQVINDNHQGEEGFVPIDGTDILSEHVLPLVKQQIVPEGIDYKNLSPDMKNAVRSIRDWYDYFYDWLKDNRTLKEDTGYNADYVNHIWDKEKSDKQAYAMYVENRQRTKSPNEKPRTISTLMEGISVGLVPKTTDITKMMAYYSRSNIEAWVNKTMLQELSGLNVIERNEDGEVVSTDPLLSSSAPFNLEQYKYFEIPGVGPVWVYNVSPKQVKVKNPITGKEKVLYSEASAGDRFGVVFETYQSSPFWKAFDTLASSAKKLELGFSGFHAGALTEVYMVQNMVEFGPKKAMANFMKYIFVDTAKSHELPCFANPQDFQEAASHLVKFGATNDYAAADVQNMFDNMRDAMMKVQEKLKDGNGISGTVAVATMPLKVVTQMLSLINKGMDRALWDFLHDGLKLATYRMRADKTKERAKEKGWSAEELSRALDEDGQFVNDMFGGQHWDVLGASHRTLRYAGRVLLSPDWNASTTRHFLALTGFGSIWNEATFENFKQYYQRLWHKELMPEDEGRRSRQISALLCYGIGFMVFYETFANGINAAFRALDEEKERKKAEEIRKTNPSYKSMYELAYGDEGMKWYDYLMRGNSLGQQSKIFMGRYEDGTEMYIRHGKQFREVPEYLFNHKGELEFPGPMVQRMIGKANPMVRMTLDDINYLSDFQASHADQEIQRKYGKTIGLLYKDALYWAPFLIPSQENKEFKAVDFFFPSSKGFSPWKAQSYFKDFILSGDMEGVVMTYQSCQRNGIDAEAQIKAAIGSVKALESAEMNDGVTSLQVACQRFDAAKSITEKKKMRQKMKKFLSQSDYKAFTQKEALDMVQGYLNGDEDLKEMEKAESKYLMAAKAEDVTEDWRIQNAWNGTMETYQEYQRLKDIDKAKANAFKNSKSNKRLFAARKAISAAKKKMNKAKKQMDGTNGAAKMAEIRKTRKELLNTLNGMD